MSDMSDPSNSSAAPIRVVVLQGITVDVNRAGGLIFSLNGGYRFVYATNAFSPFSGTLPSGDSKLASGPGNTVADGEGTGSNVVYLHSANTLAGRESNDKAGGGSGDDTVSASGKVLPFSGPAVMNFLSGGSGSRGVSGGLGSVTVFGGNAGNNQLVAGQLPGELTGAGTGDQLFAADAAADKLAVAGGNETLSPFGTMGSNMYFGGIGSNPAFMGAGAERYVGGEGNDVVIAGLGNDMIADLKAHADIVPLQGVAPGAKPQAFQGGNVSGGNTVLLLPDGTVVTMIGISHPAGSSTA